MGGGPTGSGCSLNVVACWRHSVEAHLPAAPGVTVTGAPPALMTNSLQREYLSSTLAAFTKGSVLLILIEPAEELRCQDFEEAGSSGLGEVGKEVKKPEGK